MISFSAHDDLMIFCVQRSFDDLKFLMLWYVSRLSITFLIRANNKNHAVIIVPLFSGFSGGKQK